MDKAFAYHAYTGRRVSPDQQKHQQQQQQQCPLPRRPLKGVIEDHTGVALRDSWGRGVGPSFAPKGVGPLLEPPRPPKGPTKPCWPTRTIRASAVRYAEIVRREKGVIDGAGPVREKPTVSWPEHAAMETGDVVVTVEHCHSCHRHRMTTRHDPEVYLRQANAVRELLVESLQEAPIRLAVVLKKTVLRSKASTRGGRGGGATGGTASAIRHRRVGAFEVQVAARHPSQAHLLQVRVVHSKLASGRWPRLEADGHLLTRVKATLESWGFEPNRRKVGSVDAGLGGQGSGNETLSEQHRQPRSRANICWEFDNRNCLRCAAAPAVPSRERNTDSNWDPSNNRPSNSEPTDVGQASTPAPSNDDTKQTQGQPERQGTPEDAGAATIATRDLGDAFLSSAGSVGGGESGAGAAVNDATAQSFGVEGRYAGSGDDGSLKSHASGGGGAAIDAGIGWDSDVDAPDHAPTVAATATTPRSSAPAKAPTTSPGLLRGGSEGDGEGKKRVVEESGLFESGRPAESVDTSDGDIAATGLEALLGDEHDCDPEPGDLAASTDVGDVDRIETAPRPSRGRRREHEGKEDGSSASKREGNKESSRNGSPARSVRGPQDKNVRSSSEGEAQRTPGQTAVEGAPQVPEGCSGVQDDSEAGGSRTPKRIVEANPAAPGGGENYSASVWSNSSSSSKTGRNSPKRSRGPPKTVGEGKAISGPPATTSGGCDGQEKTASAPRKDTDSRESHSDNGTAEEGGEFAAQPNVSNQDTHFTNRGRGIGDEGAGGDDSGGSLASPADSGVVKPTNKAVTQHDRGVAQSGNARDGESRRSGGYRETGGGGGGGGGGNEQMVGDSTTAGEEENASAAEEDEYGSDFASQDASSAEEVDDGNDIPEKTPPLVLPREESDVGESGEEFQWSDAEQKEEGGEEEEVEEEDEYGDDFDDDGGEFDSS